MGKRKRSKRLFPARFSATAVSVPRIDHNKAAAYNAQRSKATVGPRSNSEHKLDNNFMEEVPRTRRLSTYDFSKEVWVRSERGHVVDKKHQLMVVEGQGLFGLYRVWQSETRNQGVSQYLCRILLQVDDYKFMLFFSGDEYLFIREKKGTRAISRTYTGLNQAMQRYHSMNIAWVVKDEPIQS